MERVIRFELTSLVWKTKALPLDDTRAKTTNLNYQRACGRDAQIRTEDLLLPRQTG